MQHEIQGKLFPDRDRKKKFDRLFYALLPDSATAWRIAQAAQQFQRDHHIDNKLLEVTRSHISIQLVGDYKKPMPERFVFAARMAAARIILPTVDVVLDEIGSFEGRPAAHGKPPRRPLVMQAQGDGLYTLFDCLGGAMLQNGLRPNQGFTPHLTVSYGPQRVPFQRVSPIRFVGGELVLIHSEVGLTLYHVLGRWPLRGRMN